jgi:hypothetical protein
VIATAHTITTGIGTWGLNKTVGWAFDITNFVFCLPNLTWEQMPVRPEESSPIGGGQKSGWFKQE